MHFSKQIWLLLLILIPTSSFADGKQCKELFGQKREIKVSSLYELEQMATETINSWAVFSDPRLKDIQVGPLLISLDNMKLGLADEIKYNSSTASLLDVKSIWHVSAFLTYVEPGTNIPGLFINRTISPFFDLNRATNSLTYYSTNQLLIRPDLIKNMKGELIEVEYLSAPPIFPEAVYVADWRGTPSLSRHGRSFITGQMDSRKTQALQTYLFAYKMVFNLIEHILATELILPKGMKELAKKIWHQRRRLGELELSDNLELFTDKDSPQHFTAVTGNTPGDTIYLNRQKISSGQDVELADAIALLAHELGHTMGIKDGPDRFLDQFGATLKNVFKDLTQSNESKTTDGFTLLTQSIHFKKMNGNAFSYLFFKDQIGWVDLTSSFFSTMNGSFNSYSVTNLRLSSERRYSNVEHVTLLFDVIMAGQLFPYEITIGGYLKEPSSADPIPGFFIRSRIEPDILVKQLKLQKEPSSLDNNIKEVSKSQIHNADDGIHWSVEVKVDPLENIKSVQLFFTSDSFLKVDQTKVNIPFEQSKFSRLENGDIVITGDHVFSLQTDLRNFNLSGAEITFENGEKRIQRPQFRVETGPIGLKQDPTVLSIELLNPLLPIIGQSTPQSPGGVRFVVEGDVNFLDIILTISTSEGVKKLNLLKWRENPEILSLSLEWIDNKAQIKLEFNHDYFTQHLAKRSIKLESLYILDARLQESLFQLGERHINFEN